VDRIRTGNRKVLANPNTTDPCAQPCWWCYYRCE